MLHAGAANAQLSAWLAGCRGTQAWVAVTQTSYRPGGASYDLLHTSDSGRTWQDVLRIPDGTAIPALKLPLSPCALTTSPLPAGLTLIPEPLALTSASGGWLTLVTGNGDLALAVTPDAGQHWQMHWFPPPRHAPPYRARITIRSPGRPALARDRGDRFPARLGPVREQERLRRQLPVRNLRRRRDMDPHRHLQLELGAAARTGQWAPGCLAL
jgi:hypothetical protein